MQYSDEDEEAIVREWMDPTAFAGGAFASPHDPTEFWEEIETTLAQGRIWTVYGEISGMGGTWTVTLETLPGDDPYNSAARCKGTVGCFGMTASTTSDSPKTTLDFLAAIKTAMLIARDLKMT